MALAGASIPCHRASLWLLGCPHATAAGFPWSKMREGGIGEEKGRQSRSCSVFMNSCTPSLPHCPVGHPVMLRRRQRGRGQNIGRGGPLRPVWERAAPQPWKVSFHLTVHLPFPVRGRYIRQRLSLVFSLKGQISHKAWWSWIFHKSSSTVRRTELLPWFLNKYQKPWQMSWPAVTLKLRRFWLPCFWPLFWRCQSIW